jgi:hypothetical protein
MTPKGEIRHHNRRRTDNIMTKSKKTDKTMVDEILHRKLKNGQPKAHWKFQIGKRISCSPSGTCCVTVKRNLNIGSTTGATSDAEIAYIFRAPEFVPVFSKVFLVHFVQWHVFTFLVSCCGARYEYEHKLRDVYYTYRCCWNNTTY